MRVLVLAAMAAVVASDLGQGLPYVEGYKPARNFQNALVEAVDRHLVLHPEFVAPHFAELTQAARRE